MSDGGRWRLAVGGAVLFAAATRLVDLAATPPGLHFDEAVYGLMAKDIVAGARPVFFPAFTGREPLYIYLVAAMFGALGPTAYALRLTSALAGVVTVAAVGAAGRAWFDRPVGAAAAWLTAASAWMLTLGRNGYPNVLIPPIAALSAVWLWRAWRGGRARDAAAGGALVGLILYTYLAARFWPVCVAAWLVAAAVLAPRRLRARAGAAAAAACAAAAVFAPLGLHFARRPADFWERANQVLASRSLSGSELWQAYAGNAWRTLQGLAVPGLGDPRWHYNLPGRPLLGPGATVLCAVGAVVWLRRGRDLRHVWLALWLAVMALPGILTLEMQPAGQRIVGLAPALAILGGLGARGLWRGLRRIDRRGGAVALAAVAALVAVEAATAIGRYRAWASESATAQVFNADYAALARLAAADVAAGRTVVVLSEHHRHPTLAFLAPATFDPLVWTDPARALPVPIPRGAVRDTIVYLRPRSFARDDLPAVAWLEAHAVTREAFAARGIDDPVRLDPAASAPDPIVDDRADRPPTVEVVRYVVSRAAAARGVGPSAAGAGAVRFGDEIRAAGVDGDRADVPRNTPLVAAVDVAVEVPPAGAPGRQLVATLVAAADPPGTTRAQANGLGYLVSEWRAGDTFRAWLSLPIDRETPAHVTHTLALRVVDDALRPLAAAARDGTPLAGADAPLATVRFGVDGRVRATDAELAAAPAAFDDADGGQFVVAAAALDRPAVARGVPAVLEVRFARRWPPDGPDGARPNPPRDPGAVAVTVVPEGPAAIGRTVVAAGVVDAGAVQGAPMRDKELVRLRYAVVLPPGWPLGPTSVEIAVAGGAPWRAGSIEVR